MNALTMFALVAALATLAVGVQSEGDAITTQSCEISTAALDPVDFVTRALGGYKECVHAQDKSSCCGKVRELFGAEGAIKNCLCDREYYSALVYGLPVANGIQSEEYTNMLLGCDVPVAGKLSCPGVTEEGSSEPLVQSQFLTTLLLAKAIAGGSALGGTPAVKPASKPAPKPAPAAKPAPHMPQQHPAGHGGKKAYKVVHTAPAPAPTAVVVAPAPAPQQVVVEKAVQPAPAPAPAPTIMPKATAPTIMPKATAPAIKPTMPPMPAKSPEPVPSPKEIPEVPEVPETPEVPEVPETPEVPEVPETPEVPEVPETPEVPEVPETPEVPEVPETPEVPEVPETPEVPEVPETPEVPEVPETPEVPEVPEKREATEETTATVTGEVSGDSTVEGDADASATPGEASADARLSVTTTGGEASGTAAADASSSGCSTVAELVGSTESLSTLAQLLEATGLLGEFGENFKGTVFAPNNEAFQKLLDELQLGLDILLNPKSKDLVTKILQLHVISGTVAKAGDLQDGQSLTTLLGSDEPLTVAKNGDVLIKGPGNSNGVKVEQADVEACDAVVHILGGVLVPSPQITAMSGMLGEMMGNLGSLG